MEDEIWKSVKGYEGYYEVSNLGRIRSVERFVKQSNHLRYVPGRIKAINVNRDGYPCVTLCRNRKSRVHRIHRLVAEAFIPNPYNKQFVDHINTDITDYRIENLRWVNAKENANNSLTKEHCRERTYTKERTRKILQTKLLKGDIKAPRATHQYSKDGHYITSYDSAEDAQRSTGINAMSIRRAIGNTSASAGGYMWSYTKSETIEPYKRADHKKYHKIRYYSKHGELIGTYGSLQEAEKATGICRENIVRNARTKGKIRRYRFIIE